MVTKEEILTLKTKILPPGADLVLDALANRHEQLELTQIVLEHVPLLIIGRHGMIARIPINGKLEKVSTPEDIVKTLQAFFAKTETLYVFINLPDLPIPHEVTALLQDIEERVRRRDEIQARVDAALDKRDRDAFLQAAKALAEIKKDIQDGPWIKKRV